jgi:hypothetical protein
MKFSIEKDGIPFIDNTIHDELELELKTIYKMVADEYGPIDNTYSIIINFNSANAIVTETDEKVKLIRIHLPIYEMNAKSHNEIYQRKLNLSHEIIHTITPNSDPSKTTYLEEGLAVVFSDKYTKSIGVPSDKKYEDARKLVLKLLEGNSNIIKILRIKYSKIKIADYTSKMIKEIIPTIDDGLLHDLTKKFY